MVVLKRATCATSLVVLSLLGCGPRPTWPVPELRALLQFVAYTPGQYISERLNDPDAAFLGIGTRQACREYLADQSLADIQQFYTQLGQRHGWFVQVNPTSPATGGFPGIVRVINLSYPRYNVDLHISTTQLRFEPFGPTLTPVPVPDPTSDPTPAPIPVSQSKPPFFLYVAASIRN